VFSIGYDFNQRRLTKEQVEKMLNGIPWIEVPIIKSQLFFSFGLLLPTPRSFLTLIKLAKNSDVIHIEIGNGLDLIIFLVKIITNRPVATGILSPFFFGSKIRDIYTRTLWKFVTKHFEGKQVMNSIYENLLKSWNFSGIYRIESGVNLRSFSSNIPRDKNNIFKVLYVGRLARQKGTDILIDAIEKVKELPESKDIEFRIMGTGPYYDVLHKLQKDTKVKILGYLPDEALVSEYINCDLVVCPSRQEGFSLTVLEGCASGKPIVATNIPGLHEVVKNDVNGVLTNPSDPSSFSGGILKMYRIWKNDYARYQRLGKASREIAKEYSWDSIADKTERMFIDIVRKNKRTKRRKDL